MTVPCERPMPISPYLPDIFAVCDRGVFSPVRASVGICAAGSHFVSPHLRRLHELVAGGQGCNAVFLSECVGTVYDILFHGAYIGIIGRGCGFWMRFRFIRFCLCRCFAGVRDAGFHLHTLGIAVPKDLKSHCLAHVPELDVVVAVDDIGFHLHFFSELPAHTSAGWGLQQRR